MRGSTARFIIGNPPFLGSRLLRRGLGHEYVEDVFRLSLGRLPGAADFVVYWHEKARVRSQRRPGRLPRLKSEMNSATCVSTLSAWMSGWSQSHPTLHVELWLVLCRGDERRKSSA
jgi:hypothetical protein